MLNNPMSSFNFFQAFNILREAGEAPMGGAGGPAPDLGGPPGGMPPMGGAGGPPGMGGPPGGMEGDPMGGGGPSGQPIEVKTIPAADVWKLIEKIIKDEKYGKFFEDINIKKKKSSVVHSSQKEKKTSLMS